MIAFDTLREEGKRCLVCDDRTREGKPFCPEHIMEMPYARQIAGLVNQREEECEEILAGKPVRGDGVLLREAVWYVCMFGAKTLPRFSKDLSIPPFVGERLARELVARGVVVLEMSTRKDLRLRPVRRRSA